MRCRWPIVVLFLAAGCIGTSPQDRRYEELIRLGANDDGDEEHNPGFPCGDCHGPGYAPGEEVFALAGMRDVPLPRAERDVGRPRLPHGDTMRRSRSPASISSTSALSRWALTLLLIGCAADTTATPLPQLDEPFYAASVQPVVGVTCATLDCHGVGMRPLRLYAADGLRLRDDLRGMPLGLGEVTWNVAAFEAIDPEPVSVDSHVALTKPLSVEAGGLHHLGDPVWTSNADPGYRCLRGWLAGEPRAEPCAEAAAELEP